MFLKYRLSSDPLLSSAHPPVHGSISASPNFTVRDGGLWLEAGHSFNRSRSETRDV
jgi:hypothetical protein